MKTESCVKHAGNRPPISSVPNEFGIIIATQKIYRETDYRICPTKVLSRPLRERKKRDKASTIFGNHA